jgi:hypothetical protein
VARDTVRGRVRERIGAADDEAVEGETEIERRPAELARIGALLGRSRRGLRLDARGGRSSRCRARRKARRLADAPTHRPRLAPEGRTHADRHALHLRCLAAIDSQHAVDVVRLDPALQEASRHRQQGGAVDDRLEFEAAEPAREHVLAEFCPEAAFDARPHIDRRG